MQRDISPDKIIGYLLSMIEDVCEMRDLYKKFPKIIEKEHGLIQSGDYSDLESIVQEKCDLSDEIEKRYESLNKTARNLLCYHIEFFEAKDLHVRDLSHCVEMFRDFATALKGKNVLVEQTFEFNLKKLTQCIADFVKVTVEAKPLIELNKTAMSTIAYNYQESNRFWRELAEEHNAPYDAHGSRKASIGGLASFIVKA